MLRVRPGPPVDYSLCDETVTLYHAGFGPDGRSFACARVVFAGAHLDYKKVQTVDKTGSREANGCLLVLPSGWSGRPVWVAPQEFDALDGAARAGRFTLAPGDKVLRGEGPAVTTREAWQKFLPAGVPGLVVIRDVDPKYWRRAVTHVEGGG